METASPTPAESCSARLTTAHAMLDLPCLWQPWSNDRSIAEWCHLDIYKKRLCQSSYRGRRKKLFLLSGQLWGPRKWKQRAREGFWVIRASQQQHRMLLCNAESPHRVRLDEEASLDSHGSLALSLCSEECMCQVVPAWSASTVAAIFNLTVCVHK